jgi:UDP-N-acetylmuramoyl-tripeptide--D-alanyl-D-alanine ligase
MAWSAQELKDILAGEWYKAPENDDWSAEELIIKPAEATGETAQLFVAISPETLHAASTMKTIHEDWVDGHHLLPEIKAGIVGAIVQRPVPEADIPQLVVQNSYNAPKILARSVRSKMTGRVIAMTGRTESTTLHDLLLYCLEDNYRVVSTHPEQTSFLDLALTLARCEHNDPQFCLLDITLPELWDQRNNVSHWIRPHICIIPNLDLGQAESGEDIRAISHYQSSICEGMEPGGVAIIRGDMVESDYVCNEVREYGVRPVLYGLNSASDSHPVFWEKTGKYIRVRAVIMGETFDYAVTRSYKDAILDSLAILTTLKLSGVDIHAVSRQLKYYSPGGAAHRNPTEQEHPEAKGTLHSPLLRHWHIPTNTRQLNVRVYSLDQQKMLLPGEAGGRINEGLGSLLFVQLLLTLLYEQKIHLTDEVMVPDTILEERKTSDSLGLQPGERVALGSLLAAVVVKGAPDAILTLASYIEEFEPLFGEETLQCMQTLAQSYELPPIACLTLTGRRTSDIRQRFTPEELTRAAVGLFSLPAEALKPLRTVFAVHRGKSLENDSMLYTMNEVLYYYCFGEGPYHAVVLAWAAPEGLISSREQLCITVCGADSPEERDAAVAQVLYPLTIAETIDEPTAANTPASEKSAAAKLAAKPAEAKKTAAGSKPAAPVSDDHTPPAKKKKHTGLKFFLSLIILVLLIGLICSKVPRAGEMVNNYFERHGLEPLFVQMVEPPEPEKALPGWF